MKITILLYTLLHIYMINCHRLPFKYLCAQYFIRIFMMMSSGESSKLFVSASSQDFESAEMVHRKEKNTLELRVGQTVNGKYEICLCAFVST